MARCQAPDAGWCVSRLASLGEQACEVDGGVQMCRHGDAQIRGQTGSGYARNSWQVVVPSPPPPCVCVCRANNDAVPTSPAPPGAFSTSAPPRLTRLRGSASSTATSTLTSLSPRHSEENGEGGNWVHELNFKNYLS